MQQRDLTLLRASQPPAPSPRSPGRAVSPRAGRAVIVALLLSCLLFTGCGREEEPPTSPSPTAPSATSTNGAPSVATPADEHADRVSLQYHADANGAIEGMTRQLVVRGGSGSAVTAVPAAGYHFTGWSDGSTANPRNDGNVTTDLTVTASFAINQYTLVYAAGANGSVDGTLRQVVNHGGSASALTAVPAEGYRFTGWSDGLTANPRTDQKVSADLTVTAAFAVKRYSVSYAAGEHGTIGGEAQQAVSHGTAAGTVTAVPDTGYRFERWSDGVTTASRTDSGIVADLAVTAEFAPDTFTVGGTLAGLAPGGRVVLQINGGDDLAVTANSPFTFATALTGGSGYAVKVLTQPSAPNQTCTVSGGSGTIARTAVDSVRVECRYDTYTIGGAVQGLAEGNQLVLRNNQGDDLAVTANGPFTFSRALDDGSTFDVTIHSQRLRPKWSCVMERGKGTLAGRDVTDVDIACFPDVELQAIPGLGRIELKWNSPDFGSATFNLCRAREEIPVGGFGRCATLKGGVAQGKVKSPLTLSRLTINMPHWLQLEVQHPSGHRTYSPVVIATPYAGVNDTGIDWCADNDNNRTPEGSRGEKSTGCEALATSHPGQDAQYGRDEAARARKLSKSGNGPAGFDFTKVCASGEAAGEGKCPPNPALGDGPDNWACVRDNITGLLWEVKGGSGLRSQAHTYSWHNTDSAVNGGSAGLANGGKCQGSPCDTQGYAKAVNAQGLCGGKDWRLPTRKELISIVDNGRFNPAIDTGYFPNTPPAYFWTASPYADGLYAAWTVFFRYGEVYPAEKNKAHHVRLVREAQ